MRGLILGLAMLAAGAAAAQTAPSGEALSLAARAAHAAQPHLDQGLKTLVQDLADNYRTKAARSGDPVDDEALAEVTKSEVEAARPLLWDGMTRLYATTYTLEELKALNAFYRDNPGAAAGALPISLATRNDDIQKGEQALVAQLGPRILQDFFGDYCSRARCGDDIRRAAGLPVRAAN